MLLRLLTLLTVLSTVAFNAKASDLNSILNPKNGKHSAVILISNVYSGGSCTASVFNDEMAVTAAHCVSPSEVTNPLMPNQKTTREAVFKVYNSKGDLTGVEAKTYIIFDHADIAVLKGNFREFNKVVLDTGTFKLKKKDKLISCGYAGAMIPPACTEGEFTGPIYFMGAMTNYLARGMSGGPVFTRELKLVGVNSSRADENSRFGILFGLLRENQK